MKTYADDIHSSFLKTMTTSSSQNVQIKPTLSENTFKVPMSKELLAIQSPRIFPMLDVPTIIDKDKRVNIHEILDSLVNDFPQSVNITNLVEPKLNKGRLLPEITYPVDKSLNSTPHGNSNGEAGSSTQYAQSDYPSFDVITNSIDIVQKVPSNSQRIASEQSKTFASPSSTQFSLPPSQYNNQHHNYANTIVLPSESPIRMMDFLSPKVYPSTIGTPLEDPLLVQALEQHETHSSKFYKLEGSSWQQRVNNSFKSGTVVIQDQKNGNKEVIFSTGIDNAFYQSLVGHLSKLTYRYDSGISLLSILASTKVSEWKVSPMTIYKLYERNFFLRS
ncbi:uncharacterized protein [Triticum aestivum]|uniref:uncharacterized protein isoform X2 n=1 Tax=Triticum aestivum TaxID=4565 RepID=UPI001D01C3BE|nr:uncharacterized protein LOC123136853 isoform X2 [Triticum aestivum]